MNRSLLLSTLAAALAISCASSREDSWLEKPLPPREAPALSSGSLESAKQGPPAADTSSAAAAPAAAPVASTGSSAAPAVLGYVSGRPIELEELMLHWMHRNSREVGEYVDTIVASHMAGLESDRLGLELDPVQVEQRYQEARRSIEAEIQRGGSGMSLETFVESQLGLDPEAYLGRVRHETLRQLEAEKVVRAWVLSRERATVRVIVTPDEESMTTVLDGLAAGEDFGELAREHSIDETARRGGLVPSLVRSDQSPLSSLAFTSKEGDVAGPIDEPSGRRILIKVERLHEPVTGSWSEVGEQVEFSLGERPVEDSEFLQWRVAMERRFEVDLRPFLRMVGEG